MDDPTWRSVEVEEGAIGVVEEWLARSEPAAIDTARAKKCVRALLAENARLRSVLGHCPKGIAVLDEKGNLTGHNRELVALLGLEPVLGEPMAQHFAETDRELLAGVVKRAGTTRRAAAVLRTTEGESARDLEFLAATLPSGDARSIGVVLAGEDRTVAIADETTRQTIDDANRYGAFAVGSTASLREVEAFRADADAALERGETKRAREALQGLRRLLARAPERPSGAAARADVGDVARQAARLSWTGRARRTVGIHVEIDEKLDVACAELDLAQVLSNVLDNAVHAVEDANRFGFVTVRAQRVPERSAVEITVKDDGVGIDPGRLKRIFDPFETSRDGATGVGLSISRTIIESLGGTIRALSEPGRGTTMIIELPEAKAR